MQTLETVLDEYGGPLDEGQVLRWGIELCAILQDWHSRETRPQVYGDLKLANILLDADGSLKLVSPVRPRYLQSGKMWVGTEGYAPPEQYKDLIFPASDIYALGATLYHLLTTNDPRLEVPFSFHERLPRRLNPALSAQTEAIIMKALAFSIENRYPSAQAMQTELIKALLNLSF